MISFFKSALWKELRKKGLARSVLFAGQHTEAQPRIMKFAKQIFKPSIHNRDNEKARRRNQCLDKANGLVLNSNLETSRNGNVIITSMGLR